MKQEKEEANLHKELMDLIALGGFRYSRKIIEKASFEQLKDIKMIYDRQRAKHLVRTIISWLAIIVAKGLHKIDCLGEHQVEPLTKILIKDELFEPDMIWLLGKFINQIPCHGFISAGGRVGFEVAKHKLGGGLKKVERDVVSLVKETKGEVAKRKVLPKPTERERSPLSSVSSISSDEHEP